MNNYLTVTGFRLCTLKLRTLAESVAAAQMSGQYRLFISTRYILMPKSEMHNGSRGDNLDTDKTQTLRWTHVPRAGLPEWLLPTEESQTGSVPGSGRLY